MLCMMPVNNQDMTDPRTHSSNSESHVNQKRLYASMHGLVNVLTVGARDKLMACPRLYLLM
jgi:hypothetical protein